MDNIVLSEYSAILNRLAGSADEMGSFIKLLKTEFRRREQDYNTALRTNAELFKELQKQIEQLKIEKAEKDKLKETVDFLSKRQVISTLHTSDDSPLKSIFSPSGNTVWNRLGLPKMGYPEIRVVSDPLQILHDELEGLDWYISQGYMNIARDTLEQLNKQYPDNPTIEKRFAQLGIERGKKSET